MPKRKITKPPGKLETALWIIGVYIILFAFNYFGSSSEVYLTNRIYVSTKEDIWLWTFIQVVTLAIILIAFIVTLKLCIKALKSPYRNYYFGTFLLCLLYTSDAADERSSVDLGGRRIIKKKNQDDHGRRIIMMKIKQSKETV